MLQNRSSESGIQTRLTSDLVYEVTRRQFKEFVDAGGYRDDEYWREPIMITAWQRTRYSFIHSRD